MIRLNRGLLQQLSEQHLGDALVLLEQKRWPGAYYLAGYSVECALKACIAKLTKVHDFPHKDSPKVFTHKLDVLVGLAELEQARIDKAKSSRDFKLSWAVIVEWSEESRYDATKGEREAKNLIQAIGDNQEGVLPWIKLHW
jgi:HEPN domain-containing protein